MKDGSAPPGGRRYTVSAKVLEANRRNLAKARAVDNSIRFRATPRRLEACRRNLLKAQEAQRRSPAYAVPFIHGLYCVSLLRSLALAGEKAVDFAAHVARFFVAFRPADGVEKKLVRALAETTWRRLRAFRLQARWELISLRWCLARVAPMHRGAARAARVSRAGRNVRLGRLRYELLGIFAAHLKLRNVLTRLSRRLEGLCGALLRRRGLTGSNFSLHRAYPNEGSMAEWPPEVLNNPLVSRKIIASALQRKRPAVKSVEKWREWGTGRARRQARKISRLFDVDATARFLERGLIRAALLEPGFGAGLFELEEEIPNRKTQIPSPGFSASGSGSFEQFEALLRAFQAAVTGIEADAKGGDPASESDPKAGNLEIDPLIGLIGRLAEATWERVMWLEHWAEVEAETLEEVLKTAGTARDTARASSRTARGARRSQHPSNDPTTIAMEGVASDLVGVLAPNAAMARRTEKLNQEVEAAFGALVARLDPGSGKEAA